MLSRICGLLKFAYGLAVVIVWSAPAACALGQATIITQWDFNAKSAAPSIGAGSLVAVGSVGVAGVTPEVPFVAGDLTLTSNGKSSDGADMPVNFALQTGGAGAPYPFSGEGSDANGVEFRVSTAGRTGVVVSFDARGSNTASRYIRFLYSTDGTTWSPPASPPNGIFILDQGPTFHNNNLVDLSAVAAADNNPNFRFRLVPTFQPGISSYMSVNPGSSYNGSICTIRYDMVTVSGTTVAPSGPRAQAWAEFASICPGQLDPGGLAPQGVRFTVDARPGSSAVVSVVGDFSGLIGGSAGQALSNTAGTLWTYTLPAISVSQSPGIYTVPLVVTDAASQTTSVSARLIVSDCTPAARGAVKISQVLPTGLLAPSSHRFGYIELYNASSAPVFVGGWYVQFTPGYGSFSGLHSGLLAGAEAELTIAPHGRFLIRSGAGQPSGLELPAPDAVTPVGFEAFSGSVAVTTGQALIGADCGLPSIVDLVGYGFGFSCFEGAGRGPLADGYNAILRSGCGAVDTGDNGADFTLTAPTPRSSASPLPPATTIAAQPPASTSSCGKRSVLLALTASDPGMSTYMWQYRGGPASATVPDWTDLAPGPNTSGGQFTLNAAGVSGPELSVDRLGAGGWTTAGTSLYRFRCIVASTCGVQTSDEAALSILCGNPADVASQGATPGCDGIVTVDDLVFFLSQFFANNAAVADIVAPGGGPAEGQVTVDDLVAFLTAFFSGCH